MIWMNGSGFGHRQRSADQDGAVVVVAEREVPGAFGEQVFAVEPGRFAGFGGGRVEDLDQMTGQPAQLDTVVAGGEPDQHDLGFPDGVGREVVRQVIQHLRDGLGLCR